MLTATYTLVALSVELASFRLNLLSLQGYVRSTLMKQSSITLSQLESACSTLDSLYQACHWRKTERYLIPAIRKATERADRLLDQLVNLNNSALLSVRLLHQKLGEAADERGDHVIDICHSIETFCDAMLKRLEIEEQELFVVARATIAGETWFSIANQLMLHDKQLEEMKRLGAAEPTMRATSNLHLVIPGMQVLPIVNLNHAGSAAETSPRSLRTQPQPLDDALTK